MKTKSVMFGILAFGFAIVASAFTTIQGANDQHISDGALGCRDILDVDCGAAGSNNCLVDVQGAQSNPNIVFDDSGCDQAVKTVATSSVGETSFDEE